MDMDNDRDNDYQIAPDAIQAATVVTEQVKETDIPVGVNGGPTGDMVNPSTLLDPTVSAATTVVTDPVQESDILVGVNEGPTVDKVDPSVPPERGIAPQRDENSNLVMPTESTAMVNQQVSENDTLPADDNQGPTGGAAHPSVSIITKNPLFKGRLTRPALPQTWRSPAWQEKNIILLSPWNVARRLWHHCKIKFSGDS